MRPNHSAVAIAALTLFQYAPVFAFPNSDPATLGARAECKPYKIASGDYCAIIASDRCKISLDNLYKYNSGLKDQCGNLKVSQRNSHFVSLRVNI